MSGRALDLSATLFLLCLAGFCGFIPIDTGDIWWHVAVGRWIIESGQLPNADLWSAEPGTWHSFSWLYQLFVAKLDAMWGMESVRAVSALWMSASIGLVYVLLRLAGASRAVALLLSITLLLSFQYRIRIRPHLFNLTAFSVLALGTVRARPKPWLIPVAALLMALWSAIHAGGAMVAVGALVVLLAGVGLVNDIERRDRTVAMGVILAALVGWILTPGARETVMVVSGNQGATIAEIGEWSSYSTVLTRMGLTDLHRVAMLAIWPVSVSFWLRALVARRRQLRSHHLLPVLLSGFFLAVSFVWFRLFFLATLALAVTLLSGDPRDEGQDGEVNRGQSSLAKVALTALVLLSTALVLHHATVGRYGSVSASFEARSNLVEYGRFPELPTRLLATSEITARVALPPAWGGYVLYHGWPNLTVTMDGRNAASDDVMATSAEIQHLLETAGDRSRLPELYSQLPADVLMMPHPAFLGAEDTGEWVFFGSSDRVDLYFRRGRELEQWWPALIRVAREQVDER